MSGSSKNVEVQLGAMRQIMKALAPLDKDGQEAVLAWVDSQLGRVASSDRGKSAQSGNASNAQATARQGTVSTVAQKLGASSCRTLLLAAAAHLSLYQGKENFTRDELIACVKEARGWKADYSNQMATQIKRLLDAGSLFEKSRDIFSLSDGTLKSIEAKLAS